jgi:hypothetical protein
MVFSCSAALTSRQKEIYNFQLIQKDGEVTLRAENEKYAPITLSVGFRIRWTGGWAATKILSGLGVQGSRFKSST